MEPVSAINEKKANSRFLGAIKDFFLNFKLFLLKYITPKEPPFLRLFVLIVGVGILADSLKRSFQFFQITWIYTWLVIIVGGLVFGIIYYWVGGFLFHFFVKLAGGKKDSTISRYIFLYSKLPFAFTAIFLTIFDTIFLGERYLDQLSSLKIDTFEIALIFAALIFSTAKAYQGVRILSDGKKIRSIIIFLILPILYYSLSYGGYIYGFYENAPMTKGFEALEVKKYSEAIKHFNIATKQNPKNHRGFLGKAQAFSNIGLKRKALANYNQAIFLNPKYFQAYKEKGIILYKLGKCTEAIKTFDEAIRLNPKDATIYFYKGSSLSVLDKDKEAIKEYDKALSLDSDYTSAYFMKGEAYYSLRNYKESLRWYEKSLEIDPDYIKSYYGKSASLLNTGNADKALQIINRGIKMEPTFFPLFYLKGNILNKLEKPEQALKNYDLAIKLNPDFAEPYLKKGCTFMKLNNYTEAIKNYQKYIELRPKDPLGYYNKSCGLVKLNRIKEGLTSLRKAIDLDKNLKKEAAKDEDFGSIRNLEEFKNLIGEKTSRL